MNERKLVLVPELESELEPLFKTESEYEEFRKDFEDHMRPILEKQNKARMLSERFVRFGF